MQHYTYIHKRANDGRVFYVGLGSTKERYKTAQGRNPYWHNVVAKHGFTADIVCHWETRKEAALHEILLIECFRDMGYELTNITAGGEGGHLGVRRSAETRARLSEKAKQRIDNPRYIAQLTERAKQAMADPGYRAQRVEITRQYWADPENRARVSGKAKQQWADPEARIHATEQMRKYWATPEARAQQKARTQRLLADPEARDRLITRNKQRKGWVGVNNGQINKRVRPDQIPEGFVRGWVKSIPVSQ